MAGDPPNTANQEPLRVLILGDSISMAYTPVVRELLGESAVVVRPMHRNGITSENCAGTTNGVVKIKQWLVLDGGGFDIIHFNFGLHDLKRVHPETGKPSGNAAHPKQATSAIYAKQLRAIVAELKASGATLIFATTTPVPEGQVSPLRDPTDVVLYNDLAKAIMKENCIRVNDLYAFALPKLSMLQKKSNVHFTADGTRALAEQVVNAVTAGR